MWGGAGMEVRSGLVSETDTEVPWTVDVIVLSLVLGGLLSRRPLSGAPRCRLPLEGLQKLPAVALSAPRLVCPRHLRGAPW